MRRCSRAHRILAVLFALSALTIAVPRARAELVFFQKDYAEMGHIPNTSQGICAAAANINSLVYLRNHFPSVYGSTDLIPDWDGSGVVDQADYLTSRDKMAFGWEYNGQSRDGIYSVSGTAQHIWETTYQWFEDFAPGTSVLGGQSYYSTSGWQHGELIERTYPTWDFMWDSLVGAMDIELGIMSGTFGHAVTLTGLAFDDLDGDRLWDPGEQPEQIGYLDPNKVSQITWADVSVGAGGRYEFTWWQDGNEWYIYRAYTEGPVSVPEPATTVFLLAGLLVGTVWRQRR